MSLATAVCQCQVTAVLFPVRRHRLQRLRSRPTTTSVLLNMRKSFFKRAKVLPWISNVTLYGCLFAGGDSVHQCIAQREEMDWRHTRNVAIVALSFHGNFNYFWLRALEHRFPGRTASMIFRKLLLDQTLASPLATSVFYTGDVAYCMNVSHSLIYYTCLFNHSVHCLHRCEFLGGQRGHICRLARKVF